MDYNTLMMTSKSPIIHWRHINERNKNTPPESRINKNKSRFEFSISCSLCLPPFACLLGDVNLCLPEGYFMSPFVPVLVCVYCVCLSVV